MKLLSSFLLLILSLNARTQDRRDTIVQHALLWEVSGNGLRHPSYIYGTTHLSCQADIVLPQLILDKLLSSQNFFIETLYRKGAVDSGLLNIKRDKSLSKQLGKFCFKQTKELLEGYYGPIGDDSLDSLTTVEVLEKLYEANLGCRLISYDDTLYNIARDNHLTLKGLETMEEHQPKGAGITFVPTGGAVCDFIRTNKKHQAEYKEHTKYYKIHDINWLYRQAAYTPGGEETPYKRIYLDKRNKSWIPIMEDSMKQAASFIAFGCAHLAGRNGIISLLREKGYMVTPVY